MLTKTCSKFGEVTWLTSHFIERYTSRLYFFITASNFFWSSLFLFSCEIRAQIVPNLFLILHKDLQNFSRHYLFQAIKFDSPTINSSILSLLQLADMRRLKVRTQGMFVKIYPSRRFWWYVFTNSSNYLHDSNQSNIYAMIIIIKRELELQK